MMDGITQEHILPPSVIYSLNYVFPSWSPVKAVRAFLKQSHIGWLGPVGRPRVSDRGEVGWFNDGTAPAGGIARQR